MSLRDGSTCSASPGRLTVQGHLRLVCDPCRARCGVTRPGPGSASAPFCGLLEPSTWSRRSIGMALHTPTDFWKPNRTTQTLDDSSWARLRHLAAQEVPPAPERVRSNGKAIASMVLGIIAVLPLSWIYVLPALVMGILAVVLRHRRAQDRQQHRHGQGRIRHGHRERVPRRGIRRAHRYRHDGCSRFVRIVLVTRPLTHSSHTCHGFACRWHFRLPCADSRGWWIGLGEAPRRCT